MSIIAGIPVLFSFQQQSIQNLPGGDVKDQLIQQLEEFKALLNKVEPAEPTPQVKEPLACQQDPDVLQSWLKEAVRP